MELGDRRDSQALVSGSRGRSRGWFPPLSPRAGGAVGSAGQPPRAPQDGKATADCSPRPVARPAPSALPRWGCWGQRVSEERLV